MGFEPNYFQGMKKVLPKRKPERTRNTVFFANSFSCDLDFLYWQIICQYQTPCIPAEKKSVYFFINSRSNLIRFSLHFLLILQKFPPNQKTPKALANSTFSGSQRFQRTNLHKRKSSTRFRRKYTNFRYLPN